MQTRGKVIIFLGPPGSGKGTQAELLAARLRIPAISTGEMLRRECQSGSSLGQAVQSILNSGQLVSDDLVNQVVASRLAEADCENGCLLDGYPRTVSQAQFLERLLVKRNMPAPVVFDFAIAVEEVVGRLSRRRQCSHCGHISSIPEGMIGFESFCEFDGSPLIQRADDNPASIRERLKLYERNAGELVAYYSNKHYHQIGATRAAEEISNEMLGLLSRRAAAAAAGGRRPLVAPSSYQIQPA